MASRRVLVDDTDPRIVYSPGWFADSSGLNDSKGNFGASFNSTLHGISDAGSFEFDFVGTDIEVRGFNEIARRPRGSGQNSEPKWSCFVDGVKIKSTPPFEFEENNWIFCDSGKLTDGPHKLTLTTTNRSPTFWLDWITYTPSPSAPEKGESFLIPDSDSAIQYTPAENWRVIGDNMARMSSLKGATVSLNFTGTSISLFSFFPVELPRGQSMASYSIDGGSETAFALTGVPDKSPTVYHQRLFRTPPLPHEPHILTVKLQSDNGTTPLVVDYFILEQGTPQTNSSDPAGDSSITTGSAISGSSRNLNVAGIVCGVLALIAALCLIGFLFWRRRRRKIVQAPASNEFTLGTPRQSRVMLPPAGPPPNVTQTLQTLGASVRQTFNNTRRSLAIRRQSISSGRYSEQNEDPATGALGFPVPMQMQMQQPPLPIGKAGPSINRLQLNATSFRSDSTPPPPMPSSTGQLSDDASYYGGYQTIRDQKAREAGFPEDARR